MFRSMHGSRMPDISNLLVPGWNPGQVNGASTRSWGKTGDSNHVAPDPGVCWDAEGKIAPIGLVEMTEEEKALYATDVNSPLKIPQQQNKDAAQNTTVPNGRKSSISHGSGNFGAATPSTTSRPGTRRRETTDANPFPGSAVASPSTSRFADSSWFGGRKAADPTKEADEPEEENDNNGNGVESRDQAPAQKPNPFASLTRSNTTGTSGFVAAASLWGTSPAPAPASSGIGAGAFGSFAHLTTPAAGDKRFAGARGESRLAHLIPKDITDNMASKSNDTTGANADAARAWRPRPRTDTDPYGGDDHSASGSAALGGDQDSPPSLPAQPHAGGIFDTPVKGHTGDFGMSGLNIGGGHDSRGPGSPSDTNPYRSPPAERGGEGHEDRHHEEAPHDRAHPFGGHGHEPHSAFSTISRAFGGGPFVEGSDRSQTSSVTGTKGYPSLNTLTGWPAGPSIGTPDRERAGFASAFGGNIFSPVGDLHSPSLGSLGGGLFSSGPGATGAGATGSLRGSKLGSLFPPSMQAQMQNHEHDPLGDSIPDLRQGNPLGAIGRGPAGAQAREMDSPMRTGRGVFDELFPSSDAARLAFSSAEQGQPGLTTSSQSGTFTPTSGIAPGFSAGQAPSDPTSVQSRTMVMPDRMRWVYLDPQGQVQGPFNGLEMNDWYKAQFFSPDLRVKKIEDSDFEPLGQLIRRIGNSREPFLVPQIGIPHGPPSQTGPFSPGDRGVIPPLMGAFPSFGRTLTAEEQNNLERRKQEEQVLMARQREFLAHQQAFTKIQLPGAPSTLHHHASAHSLQSQPSFGSISSPLGLPPQPPIGALGPTPGFFDTPSNLSALGNGSDLFPPDLTAQERQMLASLQTPSGLSGGFPTQSTQPIGAPIGEGGLRSQLPGVDQLQKDSAGFSARLKEFNEIRAQRDAEETASKGAAGGLANVVEEGNEHTAGQGAVEQAAEVMREVNRANNAQAESQAQESKKTGPAAVLTQEHHLSLTEQVQKTQAAAAQAAAAANAAAAAVKQAENDDAWANASKSGMPMPFPPPSSTPLPAPTAKRQHSTLPTQFTGPSPTGTPDTLAEAAPPPLAPWASQAEVPKKGPSLKEIQEAEAKKAAKAEEVAAAARRALLEAEAAALREREKAAAIATGLPSSSTWGTVSPANTPSASSPWAKPAAVKGAVAIAATPVASSKKTLAEIQREEEVRKQKAKEIALQQGATPAASMGKRYADLASKTSAPPGLSGAASAPAVGAAPVAASGWATVGAGGKVKAPPAALSTQSRTPVPASVKPSPTPVAKVVAKPSAPSSKDTGSDAMQEFHKWLHRELSRGLSGIQDSKCLCRVHKC